MPPFPTSVQQALDQYVDLFSQRIENVDIFPRPQSILVKFRTTQPTVPIVELLGGEAANAGKLCDVRFPFLSPQNTKHAFLLDRDFDFRLNSPTQRPLAQNRNYRVRITAPATKSVALDAAASGGGQKLAVVSQKVRTLERFVTVRFHEIIVHRDSDEFWGGELHFTFAWYDDLGEKMEQATFDYYGGPKSIPIDIKFDLPYDLPADNVTIFVQCIEDDTTIFSPIPAYDTYAPSVVPQEPSHGRTTHYDWATGLLPIHIPDYPTHGPDRRSFTLQSAPGAVYFSVRFEVETQVSSPEAPPVVEWKSPKPMVVAKTTKLGEVAGVSAGDGKRHLLTVGPENTLLFKSIPADVRSDTLDRWQPIGTLWSSEMTIVAGDDGRIHLFVLDAEGAVRHRSWLQDGNPSPQDPWENLGGRMVGSIAAVPSRGGRIELFAFGADGVMYHGALNALSETTEPDWEGLGERSRGSVKVEKISETEIHLFTIGDDGRVGHKYHDGREWRPSQHEWEELAAGSTGPLLTGVGDDGSLAVVALREEGQIFYKEWKEGRWQPEGERWVSAGTVDEMLPPQQKHLSARAEHKPSG